MANGKHNLNCVARIPKNGGKGSLCLVFSDFF
jgi:hypothetical protein